LIPAALSGVAVYVWQENASYALLMALLIVIATSIVAPHKSNRPRAGVAIRTHSEDRVVISSNQKGWLADLQIANS
jgi:hypothetical protein